MSMMRVIARWVDDSLESPLAVDLVIEEGRVVGPSLAFGCIDYDGSRRPFTLDESGRIDFGGGVFFAQRFASRHDACGSNLPDSFR